MEWKNKKGLAQLNCPLQRTTRQSGYLTGYSFIEVIIGISIFSIVVMTSVSVFSGSSSGYKRTRDVQRNMESAQQAMSLMSKIIKTGEVEGPAGAGSSINLYDSSQEKCIKYDFNSVSKALVYYEKPVPIASFTGMSDCSGYAGSSNMIEGVENLQFNKIIPVAGTNVGKVTIAMKICPVVVGCSGQDTVHIQTTVSMRDYEEVEI